MVVQRSLGRRPPARREVNAMNEPPKKHAPPIVPEKDGGYGASHGYGEGHGGPAGPGDVPAATPAKTPPPMDDDDDET
jgi:hypothetical protein